METFRPDTPRPGAGDTRKCPRCGHSRAYHYQQDGERVCSQCIDNDRMAPCAPEAR